MHAIASRRGIGVFVAAAVTMLATFAAAPQAEAATLYACVKKNGSAHIYAKKPKCKKHETKLSWNAAGSAGKNGLNGANGTNGTNGTNGAEGKPGARGPSDVYEVALKASLGPLPASEEKTLTLSGLPPGAYAIFGKGGVGPTETNSSSSSCELVAGSDRDNAFYPLSTSNDFIVSISTEITHTFTSTGSVSMTCSAFSDKWIFESAETRIVAIAINSEHKTTADAT
jgi:hypothetical protein